MSSKLTHFKYPNFALLFWIFIADFLRPTRAFALTSCIRYSRSWKISRDPLFTDINEWKLKLTLLNFCQSTSIFLNSKFLLNIHRPFSSFLTKVLHWHKRYSCTGFLSNPRENSGESRFQQDINEWTLKQEKCPTSAPNWLVNKLLLFHMRFSSFLHELLHQHLHIIFTSSHSFLRERNIPGNPPFHCNINAWILKQ